LATPSRRIKIIDYFVKQVKCFQKYIFQVKKPVKTIFYPKSDNSGSIALNDSKPFLITMEGKMFRINIGVVTFGLDEIIFIHHKLSPNPRSFLICAICAICGSARPPFALFASLR
jgi:hypothetical protein